MNEMLVYRYDEMINAPIDVVFDYVDSDEKIKLWNSMFIENIYENIKDKQSLQPGYSYKTIQKLDKKNITIDCTIMEYEAPYKVFIQSKTKEGISISKYFLSREYHGTRLIVEASIIPSNFFYWTTTKLLGWTAKYIYDEQYNNLKRYVEEEVRIY